MANTLGWDDYYYVHTTMIVVLLLRPLFSDSCSIDLPPGLPLSVTVCLYDTVDRTTLGVDTLESTPVEIEEIKGSVSD